MRFSSLFYFTGIATGSQIKSLLANLPDGRQGRKGEKKEVQSWQL